MYNALNKGLELADGEWIAWLNVDEQYLEGALDAVLEAARDHPEADILFGDCLLVRPDGSLIAWRRSAHPHWPLIAASHLYVPSCATFFHRRIFDAGFRFDAGALASGDEVFMVQVLKAGFRARRVDRPLAAFGISGANLGLSPAAQSEIRRLKAASPAWIRAIRPLLRIALLGSKAACGAYRPPRRLEYAVYAGPDTAGRTRFVVERPDWRWPKEGMRADG